MIEHVMVDIGDGFIYDFEIGYTEDIRGPTITYLHLRQVIVKTPEEGGLTDLSALIDKAEYRLRIEDKAEELFTNKWRYEGPNYYNED